MFRHLHPAFCIIHDIFPRTRHVSFPALRSAYAAVPIAYSNHQLRLLNGHDLVSNFLSVLSMTCQVCTEYINLKISFSLLKSERWNLKWRVNSFSYSSRVFELDFFASASNTPSFSLIEWSCFCANWSRKSAASRSRHAVSIPFE